MAKQLGLILSLVLSLSTLFFTPGVEAANNITVVASDQDYDIAKLVSESLAARLVVTRWGIITTDDIQAVKRGNPGELLIIGGPYAVPLSIEALNISKERVGGENRIETAQLALERFFQVKARSYALPSEEAIGAVIKEAGDKVAVFQLGNSAVSQRWGRYYVVKLAAYFRENSVSNEPGADSPSKSAPVIVAVGNADNNPFIRQQWPASLPLEVTYFPLVYLKQGDDVDILFIVGSDQNIFYTQRTFERLGLKKLSTRDFWVFLALASLLIVLAYRTRRGLPSLIVLVAMSAVFIFSEVRRIPSSFLSWDSLYVYFDGALALQFLGRYETILADRSSPGTSYLTYLYFKLTSPSDANANALMILMALSILLLSYVIASGLSNKWNGALVMLILFTNPYFRDRTQMYASELPFAALTLLALMEFSSQSNRGTTLGGVFTALSSAIRPSGLLLYPSAAPHLLRQRRIREVSALTAALIISLLLMQTFASTAGVIGGYATEMAVKGRAISGLVDIIRNAKEAIYYFALILGVALVPGILMKKDALMFQTTATSYVLLHLAGLSFWTEISTRYIFPIIPVATIVAVTRINGMRSRILRACLLSIAFLINLYMWVSGYRFQSIA